MRERKRERKRGSGGVCECERVRVCVCVYLGRAQLPAAWGPQAGSTLAAGSAAKQGVGRPGPGSQPD